MKLFIDPGVAIMHIRSREGVQDSGKTGTDVRGRNLEEGDHATWRLAYVIVHRPYIKVGMK